MNRRKIIVSLALLYGCATALAVDLPLKIFTTADGLASSRVGPMLSDSRGFLWLCTEDGISRFDGTHFVNFGTEHGLPYPVVTDIVEASAGVYWIATNDGFAILDARGTAASTGVDIRKFAVSPDPAPNRINMLYRTRQGVLWLATDGGVFTLDDHLGVQFKRVELSLPYPDLLVQTQSLIEDSSGGMWIATNHGVVHRTAAGNIVHYPAKSPPATDTVMSLLFDRSGVLWIGHENGLFQLRPPKDSAPHAASTSTRDDTLARAMRTAGSATARFDPPEHDGEARFLKLGYTVRGLHEFADGRIWAAAGLDGLHEFDHGIERRINPTRPQMRDLSGAIVEDRDGNVWLATQSNGAIRISPQGFISYGQAEGLREQLAGLIEYDDRHMMALMGAMQIGWLERDPSGGMKLLPKLITAPEASNRWSTVQSLRRDSQGDWWLGTRTGLYRFAPTADPDRFLSSAPKAKYTVKDGLADNRVTRIYEDSRHDVWFATFASAHEPLTRWDRRTQRFVRYSDADGLPPFSAAIAFAEDRAGDLWISFREGGIARYRDGKFHYYGVREGLPPGQTGACMIDHADRMWCPTLEHGVLRIDKRGESRIAYVSYGTRQGLSSDLVYSIGEDRQGRIYFGWTQGLDQLDPSTGEVRHFNATDGLAPGRVFQVMQDHAGTMWVGSRTGVSQLMEAPHRTATVAPVWISGVRVAGTEIPVSPLGVREVSLGDLAPEKNSLQIDYLRINFAPGDPVRFQYKLDGDNGAGGKWSDPTLLQTVNYASLRPGDYRFQVRAVGAADSNIGTPAVISLRILPPWWQRWWAIALSLGALGVSFIAFERYRTARMQELGAALLQSQVLTGALSDSEAQFRTLAETASDAIFIADAAGAIVFANSAAERIFGRPAAAMTGISLTSLIPASSDHLRTDRNKSAAPSWKAEEMTGVHAGERTVTLEVSFAEFDRQGQRYFTAVARDITERKLADEALRRSREERIAELERVRRRIATDLHDDIGSSLTQISVLSEVVQKRYRDPDFAISSPLAYIARASSELIDSMSDIVWAINPQRDRLSELLHRMRRFAADTFTARNIEFRMSLPDHEESVDPDMRLEGNLRREVFLIFKESVNNIVRHSGCTSAEITLTLSGKRLELSIRDNGIGFDTKAEHEGHGVISMRNRAAELGAVYELNSNSEHGTSVWLSVPLP